MLEDTLEKKEVLISTSLVTCNIHTCIYETTHIQLLFKSGPTIICLSFPSFHPLLEILFDEFFMD